VPWAFVNCIGSATARLIAARLDQRQLAVNEPIPGLNPLARSKWKKGQSGGLREEL